MADTLTRREALSRLVGLLAGSVLTLRSDRSYSQVSRGPNIVLILADDLGYGDLGCYGQRRIRTPYLDAMAAAGMRFTDCYAGSPVCAPSRCSLFTGLHTGHTRTRRNEPVPLDPSDYTLAELLKEAGYTTGAIGKWRLGGPESLGTPWLSGIDYFFGQLTAAQDYYPPQVWQNQRVIPIEGNQNGQRQEYAPDLYVRQALNFIRRNAHQPFFLYLSFPLPHANNQLYRLTGNGMDVPTDAPYTHRPWPQTERNFAAMVTRLDRYVGRVLEALESEGISRNTLVLFSSDNGPHSEGGHDVEFFDSNGPLRGLKRTLYEGGIRVPMIAYWPGTIPAGVVSSQVWAFWDLMPTFGEIVDVVPPERCDGVSILPVLLGQPPFDREPLYWESHETGDGMSQAVRWGSWKAIRQSPTAPIELYDLSQDVGEQVDVAAEHQETVAEIESIMRRARCGVSPRLDWSKRSGYERDGVEPDAGAPGVTLFRYEVRVGDLDGEEPKRVLLKIMRDGEEYCAVPMTPGSSVNRWGRTYFHLRRLPPGNYRYQFSAEDDDGTALLPALGFVLGPIVPAPPYLSWTGERGYTTGGVSPSCGDPNTTLFEFRVLYRAHDGDLPEYVKLRLWRNGAPYHVCNMKPSPRTTDPVQGIIYYVKRYLPEGEYEYQFLAADQHGRAGGVASKRKGRLLIATDVPYLTGLSAVPTGSGGAQIAFTLGTAANVSVHVTNIAGRTVAAPLTDRRLPAGSQSIIWNGRDVRGLAVPNGVYLIRVTAYGSQGAKADLLTTCTLRR